MEDFVVLYRSTFDRGATKVFGLIFKVSTRVFVKVALLNMFMKRSRHPHTKEVDSISFFPDNSLVGCHTDSPSIPTNLQHTLST